jgi:monothiol glutaredoxin
MWAAGRCERTPIPMDEALRSQISDLISSHRVVLFMKGTRDQPTCGFSAQVVQILDEFLDEYHTVNVLTQPEIRDAIKQFSNWPTIPQLFVEGELVGGCDIIHELKNTGAMPALLGLDPDSPKPESRGDLDLSKACRCGGAKGHLVRHDNGV